MIAGSATRKQVARGRLVARLRRACALGLAMLLGLAPVLAGAHGFAGKRFFPATLVTDDPFVAAEATPLQIDQARTPEGGNLTQFSSDVTPLITPRFSISVGETYTRVSPPSVASEEGFENLELGIKYLLGIFPEHEAIVSTGIDAEVGGTGSDDIGAEPDSTISPDLFFGKGMGDLPDSLAYLKPVAVTGFVAPNFVTGRSGVQSVSYGLALEYNLQYLQTFVNDIGLHGPLEHVIPVVEAPVTTCTDNCVGTTTTATINPGLIYYGYDGQIGLEGSFPVNNASGSGPGVVLQFHLYMDNLLDHVRGFGKALFLARRHPR